MLLLLFFSPDKKFQVFYVTFQGIIDVLLVFP